MSDIDNAKETVKKGAKAAAAKFEAPKFDAGKVQFPEMFRELAEKGVEDSYLTATRGATEFNLKAIDTLRANVNSGFDYARELLAAKSFSEALELSAAHMRQQFEALTAQAKELSTLAQKVTVESAEPIASSVSKNFKLN